jgi:hypothetical protein
VENGTVKALSIRQPWAWAIIYAGKDIENRSWATWHPPGPFLIHAAQGMTKREYREFCDFVDCEIPAFADLPRGGIVGSAEFVGCVALSKSKWFTGPWGFVLRNAKPLEFKPCKGKLGFFEVEYP